MRFNGAAGACHPGFTVSAHDCESDTRGRSAASVRPTRWTTVSKGNSSGASRRSHRRGPQYPTLGAALCLLALWPIEARAHCAPATGSNETVTCAGKTVNQGPGINTGYGDSTQNGLTLTVGSEIGRAHV